MISLDYDLRDILQELTHSEQRMKSVVALKISPSSSSSASTSLKPTSAFVYTRPIDELASDSEDLVAEGAFSKTILEIASYGEEDPTDDFLHFLVDASFALRVQV